LKDFKQFDDVFKIVPELTKDLTDEEQETIRYQGNTLVIGRSGTGKTTCATLKILSLYLRKLLLEAQDEHAVKKDLRCVFITASPTLATRIRQYYRKLVKKSTGKRQNKDDETEEKKSEINGKKLQNNEDEEEELKYQEEDRKEMENLDFVLGNLKVTTIPLS